MDLDLLDTLSDDLDYLLNHHVPATESTEDTFAPDAPINQNCDNVLPHEHQQSPPPIGQQQIHLSTQPAAHQTVIDGSYQMVGQPSINGQQHQQSLNIPETFSTSVNHVGANNICSSVDPYTPLHQPHQQSPPPIGQQQIHLSTQPAAHQIVIDGSYQMVGQPSINGQQHQQSLNIPETFSTSVNYLGATHQPNQQSPLPISQQSPQIHLSTQPAAHQTVTDCSYQMVGQTSINDGLDMENLIPGNENTADPIAQNALFNGGLNSFLQGNEHQPISQQLPQIHLPTQPAAQQAVMNNCSYQMVGQPSNNGQQQQQSLNIPNTFSTPLNNVEANNICPGVGLSPPLHQPLQTPLLTVQQSISNQQHPFGQPIADQPKPVMVITPVLVAQNTKPLMLAVVPQQTIHTQQQQQTATVFAINPNLTSQPNQLISAPSDTLPQGNVPTPTKRKGCESRKVVEERYRTNLKGLYRDIADLLFGPEAKVSNPDLLRKVVDEVKHLRSSKQILIEHNRRSKEEKERLMEEIEKLQRVIQNSPLFRNRDLDEHMSLTTVMGMKEKLVLQSDISEAIPSTTETRSPAAYFDSHAPPVMASDKDDAENVSMRANDLNGRVRLYSDENFRDPHDFGWVEDDLPIKEHCQAFDRSCSFVTGYSDYLGQLHTEATVAAQLDAAGTAAAYEDEGMETGPAGEPVGRQEPAPGETCSSHQSKDKVRYKCGHLWCCQCVNEDETYHEKCPVCLKPDVQIRVYEPETVVMPESAVNDKTKEKNKQYTEQQPSTSRAAEKRDRTYCELSDTDPSDTDLSDSDLPASTSKKRKTNNDKVTSPGEYLDRIEEVEGLTRGVKYTKAVEYARTTRRSIERFPYIYYLNRTNIVEYTQLEREWKFKRTSLEKFNSLCASKTTEDEVKNANLLF